MNDCSYIRFGFNKFRTHLFVDIDLETQRHMVVIYVIKECGFEIQKSRCILDNGRVVVKCN
jgi:hypothetical protein